jgi:hypothetical protein
MQINLQTIEQHAGEKLRRIESHSNAADRLIALRKFLKIETQRLRLRHRFGISGAQIVAARSLIVDLLIKRIARTALEQIYGTGPKPVSSPSWPLADMAVRSSHRSPTSTFFSPSGTA